MKTLQKIIITFYFVMCCNDAFSQNYNISAGGSVSTCSGNFYDSGGSGSNYSNNEDYTITFCPSTPGQVIQVAFTSFNTENWSATYDRLSIYDGNSTSAPLIGSYAGTSSPGIINVSSLNTSGCLTFRFRSDGGTAYGG